MECDWLEREKKGIQKAQKALTIVKKLADSIDKKLKVTFDHGRNHADGCVPILDIKVWIGRGINDKVSILHAHYMKPVASRALIQMDSAHSEQMKFNVLVNEVSRVLRNCSRELE